MARLHTHSQHFLRTPQVAAELVGHSTLKKSDIVYDLGAGSGVITSVLANKCKSVVAIENEPQALFQLRQNLAHVDNVTILDQDMLTIPLPASEYSVFSNIPFSLSSDVVRKLTEAHNPPKAIYLIVQKQFARKLVPGNDHFTAQLGALIGPLFEARIRKPLSRSDFTPPPAVDTVLLELLQRKQCLIDSSRMSDYRAFVTECFERQKYFGSINREKAGISHDLRPSQLTLEQWVRLFESRKR